MNKYKVYAIAIFIFSVFNQYARGQVVSDTTNTVVTELQKEYDNKKERLINYYKENKEEIKQAQKTVDKYTVLKARIAETIHNIIQDEQSAEFVQLGTEYDSLKNINELYNDSLVRLDSIFEMDSLHSLTITNEYRSLNNAKNLLFGVSIEVVHREIEDYLRNGPYSQETNEKLLKTINQKDKYFLILENYCSVTKTAYVYMKSLNSRKVESANRSYKTIIKPEISQWRNNYSWLCKQFDHKEKNMDKKIHERGNPIPKTTCKSQQK